MIVSSTVYIGYGSYILNSAKQLDSFPNKDIVWFDKNTDRLLFLGECLNKFK